MVIAYDDSDGWYDRQMSPIVNQSNDAAHDGLTATGTCGTNASRIAGGYQDRCGHGPRLPLIIVSPYAKTNFVDHTRTDQSSILRFIEDNWKTGRAGNFSFDEKTGSLNNLFDFSHQTKSGTMGQRNLILDPATGQPVKG